MRRIDCPRSARTRGFACSAERGPATGRLRRCLPGHRRNRRWRPTRPRRQRSRRRRPSRYSWPIRRTGPDMLECGASRDAAGADLRDAAGSDAVSGGDRRLRRGGQDLRAEAPGSGDRSAEPLAIGPANGALARVVVARVDAADGVETPVAIASAAYAALDRDAGGVDYSALLDESAHAGGDPLRAAKAASERHEEIVRKLEAERSQSDDIEARRARLGDALLYDTPGSRVDVFVRANRGAIEARLRRFDLAGSDPAVSFRDLVRDMTSLGAGSRAAIVLRAIWAYGSQRRLLAWAIVAFALAFGLSWLDRDTTAASIGNLERVAEARRGLDRGPCRLDRQGGGDFAGSSARWRSRSIFGAPSVSPACCFAARGCSITTFAKGVAIWTRGRGRSINAWLRCRSRRKPPGRNAEAAARRAGGKAAARAPGPDFLDAGQGPSADARAFLAALSERIGRASIRWRGAGPAGLRHRQYRRPGAGGGGRMDRRGPWRHRTRLCRRAGA